MQADIKTALECIILLLPPEVSLSGYVCSFSKWIALSFLQENFINGKVHFIMQMQF